MSRHRLLPLFLLTLSLGCSGRAAAPSFRTQGVTRGPLVEAVSATGEVSALVTVNVGSQVSGTVSKWYADFNAVVKRGQLLAELDPRLFKANLERADAGLAAAQANVEKAKVTVADAERTLRRATELAKQSLISQADVDAATTALGSASAQQRAAEAAVMQARADRDLARTNLELSRIESPIDGIVVSRNIDVGQTVAASFQAPVLFVIANDLSRMQILANIDEADVGKVKDGLEAKFTVDAYPGEEFHGSIREVRQAPNTIQNVVTYAAVIEAANPERKLRQGMTASVTVVTNKKPEVLRVPNAALRWKPEEASRPMTMPGMGFGPGRPPAKAAPRGDGPSPPARVDPPVRGVRLAKAYKVGQGGQPTPVNLKVGITDGHQTEIVDGLAEGDEVIIGTGTGSGGDRPEGAGGGGGGARRGGP